MHSCRKTRGTRRISNIIQAHNNHFKALSRRIQAESRISGFIYNREKGMDIFKFLTKTAATVFVTVILAPFYFFILLILYKWRKIIGPRIVQIYSRICLSVYGVQIEVKNYDTFKKEDKGILIISNHVSFLDIFVLSALFGATFVSKSEVKYYPVVGQIASLMGVIFLDRRSSGERLKILNIIADECSNRILAVFPQGTTSLISERLSFSRGIFKVVELNPDISILPVTLRYKNDQEIAWNSPQSFMKNAIRVSAQQRIDLKVIIHDPVTIDSYQVKTAAQICKMIEQTVLEPLQKEYRDI
jgi:1-acyl-sn-glycerol-3-phosphate acyltransferase